MNFNYENRGGRPNEMGDNLRATLFPAGRVPKSVHAQNDISCVIFTDGAVTCFGRASAGELGLESLNDRGKGANEMGPGTQFVNLGSGRTASDVRPGLGTVACGILDDSRFKCWGQGNLAQGTNMQAGHAAGTMGDALPPVFLGPGNSASRIQALTVGREHVCVLYPDRRVKCFGDAQCALGIDACRRLGATNDMLGDNVPFVSLL